MVVALLPPVALAASVAGVSGARALYDEGRLEAAEQAFNQIAATNPNDPEVNFFLGEFALRRNEAEKAIVFLEQSVASAPNISRYHHRLGDAYGRAAQQASIFSALRLAKKCVAAFQRAVALDPGNLDARYSLFTFYRSAPGIIGGGAERAATEAAAIKQLDPDRGRIAFAALHVSQKNFRAARAELAQIRPLPLPAVQGDHAYLSDVQWSSASVGWGQPARNHTWFDEENPGGVILLVHGRLHGKGLYAHSPSRYTFALDGKWRSFTATVGLRDGAHQQGSAVFVVRADGRELFRSVTLRVNASQPVRVDVATVRELELVAEPGEQHNHFSWAIWADAAVHR
jgi:hypothetical protein